jgi:hypothetical protein
MIAYKFLRPDGSSVFTGFDWPLPGEASGAWVEAPVELCRSGIHACRPAHLPYWVGRSLYEVELAGDIVEDRTKVVASRARLLRRVAAWDDAVRDEYTRWCAARAHRHALAIGASPPLREWDKVIEPSVAEGPALLGFVAARIAEERHGMDAYHDERDRQTAWLVERLGLPDAAAP